MPKFYLPVWFAYVLALILFFGWIKSGFTFYLIVIGIVCIFILFRRKKVYLNDNQSDRKEVILSPVNGKIVRIRKNIDHIFFGKNLIEVQFIIHPISEYGIFLPSNCEIKDIRAKRGESFNRYTHVKEYNQSEVLVDGISLMLETSKKDHIGLQLVKCIMGFWPEVAVATGDRGKSRANIGYFPLGGTVLLYLPENCEILVGINDNCVATETVLGAFSEGKEVS